MPSSDAVEQEKQECNDLAARENFAQKINEAKKCYVVKNISITGGKTAASHCYITTTMVHASTRRRSDRLNIRLDQKYRGWTHKKVLDAHATKIREQVSGCRGVMHQGM